MKHLLVMGLLLLTTLRLHAQTDTEPLPTPPQVMQLGRGTANTLGWHPDGEVLAVGGMRGLWLYDDALADRAFFEDVGEVSGLAWSPDGERLATLSRDGTLQVWSVTLEPDTVTHEQLWAFNRTTAAPVRSVAWSPEGQRLAVITDSGAQVLDGESGDLLLHLPDLQQVVTWHPDGSQLSGVVDLGEGVGSQIRVWDSVSGAVVDTFISPETQLFWSAVEWSPDGTLLVGITTLPATLHAWQVSTGALLSDIDPVAGEFGAFLDLWWIESGQQLITAERSVFPGYSTVLQRWDTAQWTSMPAGTLPGEIGQFAHRPNSDHWALLTIDGQLMIWSLETATPVQVRSAHGRPPAWLVWSPDSRGLAAANGSGETFTLWEVTLDEQPRSRQAPIPYPRWQLEELRWSGDGRTVFGILSIPQITAPGAFPTAFVLAWDAETGVYAGTLHETPGYVAHDGSGDSLPRHTWNADFTRVVTQQAGAPLTVSRVERENGLLSVGEAMATLEVTDQPVLVRWSPDSTMLAVVTRDPQGETKGWVYDAGSGERINRLRSSFYAALYDLSWSPDSARVALVGSRGIAGSGATEHRLDVLAVNRTADEADYLMTVLDLDTHFYHAWHPGSGALAVTTSSGIGLYRIQEVAMGVDVSPLTSIRDVRIYALAWSPDGAWLAGSHEDGTLRVWEVTEVR